MATCPATDEADHLPIIDSHIHLYAASHIPRLNWTADLPSDHVLNRQNSVDEYRTATTRHAKYLKGFVFLETDRKSGLADTEWNDPLNEVDFLIRTARGTPLDGEGHRAEDSNVVLGIVPWAPVPAGREALADYLHQVRQRAGDKWLLIKGFRYLVQDKPAGTMVDPKFIEDLTWLGDHDLTFDLGIDARQGGLHQLEEACEMMDRLYEGRNTLRIIINHLCKPNLRIPAQEVTRHPDFVHWAQCIQRMARHKYTYMKLSGMFSELPMQSSDNPTDVTALLQQTKPWVDRVFEEFGLSRIMFGSDWPVCNVGGPGTAKSWNHWYDLVNTILTSRDCSEEDRAQIWAGSAAKAYNIT
ncbi:L-rhamnono-gamma-lactonase [Cladophialophora chaetospira]|uniref:L-rhamnono-gamma-lactonase n=1 Tax=Cladophialophora chaetospira TaxID=386627 RepID=A0AA38XGE1_9EURO|nr:L-rhamnono-gamma-lactonase [Cladophialophora chaetospira]